MTDGILFCSRPLYDMSANVQLATHRNYTYQGRQAYLRPAFRLGAELWDAICGINLTEVAGAWPRGDILGEMVERVHGDSTVDLGEPGGVLAHAWPLPRGQVHFDWSEPFTMEIGAQGIYLPWISGHEWGHVVNLGHNTSDPASIMNPYYRHGQPAVLSLSDVVEAVRLWGPATAPPPEAPPEVPPEQPQPKVGDRVPKDLVLSARTYEEDVNGKLVATFGLYASLLPEEGNDG